MDSKKKEILEALEEYNGIVTVACNSIGLARSTYYNWCQEDEEFKKAVDEIQEVAIDYVESKLFEKINGVTVRAKNQSGSGESNDPIVYDIPPSDTAIIFYLKTKGKKRGYIEKSELGIDGNVGLTWNEVRNYDKPNEFK